MPEEPTDHRQATAARNAEAILDAAERLLMERRPATISAVADEARTSRVTVYAHFADRRELLEAVVARAVERWLEKAEELRLDEGPAPDALARVIEAGWEELSRISGVAEAAAGELDPEGMSRTHERGQRLIRRLVERGRREGEFRSDVPVQWLVTSFFALMHAAHAEVAAGRLRPGAARTSLLRTVPDLFRAR